MENTENDNLSEELQAHLERGRRTYLMSKKILLTFFANKFNFSAVDPDIRIAVWAGLHRHKQILFIP